MKVEKSKVQKFKITEVKNLDPVNVFLEDFEPGKGEIIIECYGKAWSVYWGAMGSKPISVFFCYVDNNYIIGKLDGGLCSRVYESPDDEVGTPNYQYEYLSRIIDTVKEALK